MKRSATYWLIPAGVFSAGMGLLALLLAWSELNLAIARTHLDRWWDAPDAERLALAGAAINRAATLSFSGADIELLRGEHRLIKALRTRIPEDFAEAAAHFQAAVGARPLWPDAHAWSAVALLRAGDREGATQALRRSLELGPRAGRLLKIFERHAAAIAPLADPALRSSILDLADQTAHREPRWTAAAMRRLGWLELWCMRSNRRDIVARECARISG